MLKPFHDVAELRTALGEAQARAALLQADLAARGDEIVRAGGHEEAAPPVHRDVVDALAQALTERDRYTAEHSASVVVLTEAVADGLGLDAATVEQVATAALLHDIGKVAIPDAILHKPSALDADELALMREHPAIGERILAAIPGLGGVAQIVRHEHERWDGRGYPDGLAEQAIPVGSRIILACDAYHAMTSDRPYRGRMQPAVAVDELVRCAGSQLDPQVVELLVGHLAPPRRAL